MLKRLLSNDLPRSTWLAWMLAAVFLGLAFAPFLFPGVKALSVAAKILVNPRAPAALTTVHLHVVLARRLKQVARLLTRRHVQRASLLVALTPKSVHQSHAHRVNFQPS
jgi:NO-binding membrane sensor protein with MHYT domain